MRKIAGITLLMIGAAGFALGKPCGIGNYPPCSAPEPAGAAVSVLGLLAGAVLVVRSRQKK